ncbi:restriction endonuclease subunit S [Bifidobacterium adolescentis]|nr:restriction endonuclease subunit S [Bifidobacterium adolescentis]KAB5714140.1 restriction endonuclease subunit S [Bifidobacterium adolescentis]KAB5725901.1 restriction endonuclease subunit S [Bifidobacterium adolescentis]KAB5728108.1 restriction endonuclease subunit S [Bifidobacterium adolescentis]
MLAIWRVWKSSKHCSGVNDMAEQHEKALVPQIRFTGFTDPWEQRKLGQHLKLSRELGHTGVDARKLTVKLWGKGVVEKTDLYGGSAQTQYYIRHAGQFMYGKLDFLHAAFGVVPDKLDCFESTLDSPAFDIEGLDSSFLLNLVTQEDFYLKNGNIANGSRKAKRIHEETFLNMEIRAPELVEQRRIGAFLDRLDSLITLHQRKYDKLCVLKKSMLDKMFPKGGSLYPEIRFAGFTDPWEQRKLGELFEEHSEKDRDDLPALTIIQGGGTVHRDESNRNLQFDRNSLSNYKVVDTGDFIVHLRSFEGGLEKATCCGLVSPAYHIFRGKNVDSDFYYLYFRSKRFIDADLKPHVYGIRDGRSIDIEGMKTIFIPWTNLAEQRRIGAFFDRLDSLITLHQRKLELLRNIKKSMLDEMFV